MLLVLYKGVTNVGEVSNVVSDVHVLGCMYGPKITDRVLPEKDMHQFVDGAKRFPGLLAQ
jgi:hypothetical protein